MMIPKGKTVAGSSFGALIYPGRCIRPMTLKLIGQTKHTLKGRLIRPAEVDVGE